MCVLKPLFIIAIFLVSALGHVSRAKSLDTNGDGEVVGLVLSGGGARGAAHVGVLDVLEELQVPVDFIIGASMGSIVGGLYASGVSPEEMEAKFLDVDWIDSFNDSPDRKRLPFRRKEDDLLPTFRIEFGLGPDGFKLPPGVVAGQKLNFILRSMLIHASKYGSFDDLPIPFRAIAADLDSGDVVVLDHGDLPSAIRASMAFPLLFTPVEIEGRTLVDGGVLRNLPIDVAIEMGADRIIAVDVSTPLRPQTSRVPSALEVSRRAISLMSKQNLAEQRELIREQDVLIVPDLGDYRFEDFVEAGEIMELGEQAARAQEEELRAFSSPGGRYETYIEKQRAGTQIESTRLDFVEVTGVGKLSPKLVRRQVRTQAGDQLDVEKLQQDLERVYKSGEFSTVEFRIEQRGDQQGLVIVAREKDWGPWYVRPGITAFTDLAGSGEFVVDGLLRRPQLNRFGAEWKTFASLGSTNFLFTEIFQPVEARRVGFVSARVFHFSDVEQTINLNDVNLRYDGQYTWGDFDLGAQLGNYGELRFGWRTGKFSSSADSVTAGNPATVRADIGAWRFRGVTDRLDNVNFPGRGYFGVVETLVSRESLGATDEFRRFLGEFTQAGSFGRYRMVGSLRYGTDVGSELPAYAGFRLGGFLNLSGLKIDELDGDYLAFARLIGYRQFGTLGSILGGNFYLGASLESGNLWRRDQTPDLDDLRLAGSVWAGVDTLVGPVYVAYGLADGGNDSFYLFIGRTLNRLETRF